MPGAGHPRGIQSREARRAMSLVFCLTNSLTAVVPRLPLAVVASLGPSGGGPRPGTQGAIQSREARRAMSLVFPSISSQWLPILGLDYAHSRGAQSHLITKRRSGIWMHEFIMTTFYLTTFSSMTTF